MKSLTLLVCVVIVTAFFLITFPMCQVDCGSANHNTNQVEKKITLKD